MAASTVVTQLPVHRVANLIPDEEQRVLNMTVDAARRRVLADDPEAVLGIHGSFALVAREGERVRLARSLGRPLRYFLAKETAGPLLVVADRIDRIHRFLEGEGYASQFHPTYTRMVPAHHVTEIALVGCPDPNPRYTRFFAPPMADLPPDLNLIGRRYVEAALAEIHAWLDAAPANEPLGVLFSGGLDSGALLLCLHDALLQRQESPARLKAFTLAVEGGGEDAAQARRFVRETGLEFLLEEIDGPADRLDPRDAVAAIEDYKPRDVECATVALALLAGIRQRYPAWSWLFDGDGGDENLKDYPIEENTELTIRSVVSNRMLYQEGWGVDAIKHSLTYSGGLSRGCVRGYAPARRYGFHLVSPYTAPNVIAVGEGIPFDEISGGSHERLYALKGEVLSRGIRQVLGRELPVFAKRRFQHGAMGDEAFDALFSGDTERYRGYFLARYAPRA
ncbi:MAG: asparagine synthetase B family protein [Acidobacteria bacterium]|nr:asparagine synthetase B family protein [Acidobacteriota bacterium]